MGRQREALSSKGDQGEMTIQADVGPGDVTGVYYITICNLPFDTSWQQIKDWLRPYCEVDRVEVFQTSTSGWIRLKGRENFLRAWERVNGGVFHGRSLIASDKNRNTTIKIKELVEFGPPSRSRLSDGPLTQPTSPMLYGSPLATATPSRNSNPYTSLPLQNTNRPSIPLDTGHGAFQTTDIGSGYNISGWDAVPRTPIPLNNYGSERSALRVNPYSSPVHFTNPSLSGATDPYQHHGQQRYLQNYTDNANYQTARSTATTQSPASTSTRLVLKNIPRRSGPKDVDAWVYRKLSSLSSLIQEVQIPLDEEDMRPKGHVYVTIRGSTNDATTALKKLHQQTFRGRTISAAVARESSSSTNSGSGSASKRNGSGSCGTGEGSSRHGSGSRKTSAATMGGPVIAEGSMLKGKLLAR